MSVKDLKIKELRMETKRAKEVQEDVIRLEAQVKFSETKMKQKEEFIQNLQEQMEELRRGKENEMLELKSELHKEKLAQRAEQDKHKQEIRKITKLLKQLEVDFEQIQKNKKKAEERSEMLSNTLISHEAMFKKEQEEIH